MSTKTRRKETRSCHSGKPAVSGDGKWNTEMVEAIGVSALENGLIIKVKDISGRVIWDATAHNTECAKELLNIWQET